LDQSANSTRKYKSRMWNRGTSKSYNDLVEYKLAQQIKAVKEYRTAKQKFERKLAGNIKSNPNSFFCIGLCTRSKTKVKYLLVL